MTHPVGEVHLHGKDANILGAGVGVVGSGAVGVVSSGTVGVDTISVDTVGSGHFEQREGSGEEEEGWRGEDKEGGNQ